MKKIIKKVFLFLLVILTIGVGIFFYLRTRNVTTDTNSLEKITVEKGNVEKIVTVSGEIQSMDSRDIYSENTGKVVKLYYGKNDYVEKKAVFAEIEYTDRYGQTKTEDVLSPMNGTVVSMDTKVNAFVTNQQPFAKMSDLTRLEVLAQAIESEVGRIKVDQDVSISFTAFDGITVGGKVIEIDTSPTVVNNVINSTAQYSLRISMNTIPSGVLVGMTVNADITIAKVTNVVAISDIYIYKANGKDMVKIYKAPVDEKSSYTIEEREIKLGLKGESSVEVLEGLVGGEEIVLPTDKVATSNLGFTGGPFSSQK